jgi:ectoine hydroxylase-related dioxygenase (phytanoyl-CoA dioxygenase family)
VVVGAISADRLHAARDELDARGVCVVEGVLSPAEALDVRRHLLDAAAESERRGVPTFLPQLDPNAANVRVFNLLDLHACFRELIVHPAALALVQALLGDHYAISNFTANIARPGSRSMSVHSDQALVVPEPWLAPWSINIIWCLDDVTEENGGTLFLPGSHRATRRGDLPERPIESMQALTAPRGSIAAMDGRVWHTSGANVTKSGERALLFGYYSADFLRPQTNFNVNLSETTKAELSPQLHALLGLGPDGNTRVGGEILGERP